MKKVFLVLLAAGLFVACGNKNQAEEAEAVDSVVTEEVVVEEPVVEQVVEEAPVAEAAPAEKTVKQVAKETGESVAKTAIKEAGAEATEAIQTKRRTR